MLRLLTRPHTEELHGFLSPAFSKDVDDHILGLTDPGLGLGLLLRGLAGLLSSDLGYVDGSEEERTGGSGLVS